MLLADYQLVFVVDQLNHLEGEGVFAILVPRSLEIAAVVPVPAQQFEMIDFALA